MTVMKLSDALRLADEMGLPQIYETYIEVDSAKWGGEKPATCALGGAIIAAGLWRAEVEHGLVKDANHLYKSLPAEWVVLRGADPLCCPVPPCGVINDSASMVIHLNDAHHWERSSIADYLDAQAEA